MTDEVQVDVSKAIGAGAIGPEIGQSGLVVFSGRVHDEWAVELQGDRGLRRYREMIDNSPVVGAVLTNIDMAMRQVDWNVNAHDDDPNGAENADWLMSCLTDMSTSWEDTLSGILTFLPFGWSYFEMVYKVRQGPEPAGWDSGAPDAPAPSQYNDGRLGWRKWALRRHETLSRWEIDDHGGIRGMWQRNPTTGEEKLIPIEKSLLFRTTAASGSPEGRSIMRTAVRTYHMMKRTEEFEGIGLERDLAGLPVLTVPARLFLPDASAQDKAVLEELKKIVRNIRVDEQAGVILPAVYDERGNLLYKLELLSAPSRKQYDTSSVIQRYAQYIFMSMISDFIPLGHENVGSYALGSTKYDAWSAALGAWLDLIADIVNTYAIPRLWRLNGLDPALSPNLSHSDVKAIDFGVIADGVLKIAQSGAPVWPNDALLRFMLAAGNLPSEPGVTEEVE